MEIHEEMEDREIQQDYDDTTVQSEMEDTDSIYSVSSPILSPDSQPSTSKESTPSLPAMKRSATQSGSASKKSKKKKTEEQSMDNLTDTLSEFIKIKSSEKVTNKETSGLSSKKKSLLNFFDDIAESILKFPELEQAELKRDIFKLVNDKEIKLLRHAREPIIIEDRSCFYSQRVPIPYSSFPTAGAIHVQQVQTDSSQGSAQQDV